MNKYVTPTTNGDNFTKDKHYKIMHEYDNGRVLVKNDKGIPVIVRVDGEISLRLGYNGKFKRCSELLSQALNIAGDAQALAERERIRDEVAATIRNACLPGGEIFNYARGFGGSGWRIQKDGIFIQSENFNENPLAERLRKAEHDRDLYKQDCIKAEAVIDQLYDLFPQVRNHDQLIAAVKRAKIFSDAFIELQKTK
uniref:Uncharacterized protein n=1 Tax=Salmonella phage PMBT35 TaxID=3137287 RepID=A0AAU8BWT4_9VIRU